MNIIDALNVFYKEDIISDFLVNCFKDSTEFLIRFLNEANIQVGDCTDFHVDTRVGLGKDIGTPDIIIRASANNNTKFIIVENKMGAEEGHEQTNRYESSEAKARIANKYHVDLKNTKFHFIFLALNKTVKPINSQFTFLNYDLFLQGEWPLQQKALQLIFNDFQQKLRDFYEPLNTPFESLESDIEMDRVQRKFCWQKVLYKEFVSNQNLLLNLREAGGNERNNYVFSISKSNWTSEKPFKRGEIGQSFNVYIDSYIDESKLVKEIDIHYESFPYKPYRKIKNLKDYERFAENRRIFEERLYERVKGMNIHAQLKDTKSVLMTVQIQGTTILETVLNIKKQVVAIEPYVDEVIREMKAESLIK